MNWLAGWDFPSRTAPALPTLLAQFIFALLVTIAMIVLRMAIDMVAPSAGALSLLYPAVLVATLFGRWLSGALTLAMTMGYTIYFVLPPVGSFALDRPAEGPRLAVNIGVLLGVLLLAELFRAAVERANAERDRQIETRDLLLRELDHRVKNNFSAVSSILQMQMQRSADPAVRHELGSTLGRVEGIATAHRFLYHDAPTAAAVDMSSYLEELCRALGTALTRSDRVALRCVAERILVERDKAITIGLIVNELVTNAVRHAFPDDRGGTIIVSLRQNGAALELTVVDDGCGISAPPREGSLGRRLIAAFVKQVKGELTTESSSVGTRCRVVFS